MNLLEMLGADSAFLLSLLKWTLIALFCIIQAILTAVLAHEKGYSAFCGFMIGLFMPIMGLIFEAGRPLSCEKEEERQRQHARELARVLRRDIFGEDRPTLSQPLKRRITSPRD